MSRASAPGRAPTADQSVPTAADGAEPTELRLGCLAAGGLVLLGVVVAVMLSVLLTRGDATIELGVLADYEPGSVVYRSDDRFFVVRLADGPVIALSDLDPHAAEGSSRCRVTFRPDLGEAQQRGRFFDACTGSLYDSSGRGLAGDGLDLRRLPVREEDGRLHVRREDVAAR